jgi:oxygen-independent coproporphyrinogen-3 oxidase
VRFVHHQYEDRYRRLRAEPGPITWNRLGFEAADTTPFLAQALPRLGISKPRPRAFEYGTGTGPGACWLAARGFQVDAVDSSPTAVALARRFAAQLGLDVRFEVADVCALDWDGGGYDVVLDAFCLHAILADADRLRVMRTAGRLLAPDGHYLVACALHDPARDYAPDRYEPESGLVYGRIEDPERWGLECVRLDGAFWVPRRRLVTAAALRAELEAAGFEVTWQEGGRVIAGSRAAIHRRGSGVTQSTEVAAAGIPLPDLDRIAEALGHAARIAYAPPHVYPMSVPAFRETPCAERPRPAPEQGLCVYLHVPFCNYGCSFCFYAKRVGSDAELMARTVDGLGRELEWIEPGTPLLHLYVGGGTPTALPAELLDRALGFVHDRMPRRGEQLHTVEASPESLSEAHVRVLRARGVDRVSLGIQSFDEAVLAGVQRRHGAAQALAALDRAVEAGFAVNADLIYGLPGQSEASFLSDLETVAARGAHSVTLYNLRLNERTPVAGALLEPERLDLARLVRWRMLAAPAAAALGFTRRIRWHTFQREAAAGARARSFDDGGAGDQLGAGVSARSRLAGVIYRNHADLRTWLERVESGRSPVQETFVFDDEDRRTRFVARSLGDGQALERARYERAFGRALDVDFGEAVARLERGGLVEDDGERISLTPVGMLVHDLVTLAFYPPRARRWLEQRARLAGF